MLCYIILIVLKIIYKLIIVYNCRIIYNISIYIIEIGKVSTSDSTNTESKVCLQAYNRGISSMCQKNFHLNETLLLPFHGMPWDPMGNDDMKRMHFTVG
jgi:hypothetical protein